MKIVLLAENNRREWDDFCLRSDDAWFWHTTNWLDYCVSYGAEKYETKNISFYLSDDSGMLAISPLLLEKKNNNYEFSTSGSGGYGVAPAFRDDLSEDRREKIQKEIFLRIDELAGKYGVKRSLFRISPLASERGGFNWLLKNGYLDNSLNSQVIDLLSTEDDLWSKLRKGHKYDANRGVKYYEIKIYDSLNADKDIFEKYRLLHHKAAGRVTRPIETFEMMYQWIVSGEGILCSVSHANNYVGFTFVNIYKDSAYYSSASDDSDFKSNIPISHIIQWSIIKWLKSNGYKKYEIGTQQFGPQLFDLPSAKDMSISFFKRGFGGRTVPFFHGIKYYDREVMKHEMTDNMHRLLSAYWSAK